MNGADLSTKCKITWCPGCPNSQILVSFRKAVVEMVEAGDLALENLVAFSGVGCHGKISDYLNINSFTSLHGRLVPSMTGAKLANAKLSIVGFSGDGDSYDEGLEHLVHAAKRNSDVSLFVHENQLFALTTGQADAISPKGFKSKSTPFGSVEEPLDPLLLMLSAGATFVARTYAGEIEKTKDIMKQAMTHKGFSFVSIIQPCVTFFNTRDYFNDRVYWVDESFPTGDMKKATEKVQEKDKTPLGIFYKSVRETFEDGITKIF